MWPATLLALIRRHGDSWSGCLLRPPHRSGGDWEYLTRYLGAPFGWPEYPDNHRQRMEVLTQDQIAPSELLANVSAATECGKP